MDGKKVEMFLEARSVGKMVEWLGKLVDEQKIAVVCWDFDQTAITGHTGGKLEGDADQVEQSLDRFAKLVAPGFRQMVRYLVDTRPHIVHSIVSFGDNVLKRGPGICGPEMIAEIIHRGFNWPRPSFHIVSFYPIASPKNKNIHIKMVTEKMGTTISNDRVLLIDNDIQNCRAAVEAGYRAWHVVHQLGFLAHSVNTKPL